MGRRGLARELRAYTEQAQELPIGIHDPRTDEAQTRGTRRRAAEVAGKEICFTLEYAEVPEQVLGASVVAPAVYALQDEGGWVRGRVGGEALRGNGIDVRGERRAGWGHGVLRGRLWCLRRRYGYRGCGG